MSLKNSLKNSCCFSLKNSSFWLSKQFKNNTCLVFFILFLILKHSFEKSCFWDSKIGTVAGLCLWQLDRRPLCTTTHIWRTPYIRLPLYRRLLYWGSPFIQLPEAASRHRAYLGVSEATLFETVFETQKKYKKDQTNIIFRLVWGPKRPVFETKKQLFLRLFLRLKKACLILFLTAF